MHDQGRPQNRGSCWGSPGAGCPSWGWQGGGISTRHCLQGRNFLQGGIESSVTGGKQGLIPACGDSKGSVGLGVDRQGWGRGRGPAALSRLCLASVFTRVSCPEAAWRWGGVPLLVCRLGFCSGPGPAESAPVTTEPIACILGLQLGPFVRVTSGHSVTQPEPLFRRWSAQFVSPHGAWQWRRGWMGCSWSAPLSTRLWGPSHSFPCCDNRNLWARCALTEAALFLLNYS